MSQIPIKKLTKTAKLPSHGSEDSAGYDLHADIEHFQPIYPGCTEMIPTGLAMAIPKGYFGAIFARSGLASKQLLRPGNCVGVIDSDYRGEIKVALHNDNQNEDGICIIEPGQRIAQIVFLPFEPAAWTEVDDLPETERSLNGFGSTGK